MSATVYWIKKPAHTDIFTEGYVGISNNPDRRFREHRYGQSIVAKAIRADEGVEMVNLATMDLSSALDMEKKLRPTSRIGWNQVEGGGLPPSRKGTIATLETRKKQSEALKGRVKAAEHMAKIKIATKGKQPDMTGSKRDIVECPHCHKTGGVNGMIQWHFDKCKVRRD